jgi:tRNA (guanine-N7-)-methyltransferase
VGRRALPKINPALDITGRLLEFDELPRPWQTAALFGREGPLEVEIGSGKGLFLRSAGVAQPQVNYLGIEVAFKYARFAAAKAVQAGATNVVLVHGDALRVFAELLPDAQLDAVHVYFPDPWWKKRHKKRRVVRESLLADIQRTLRPGGRFHLWTDVEEYYQTALALIAASTQLEGPLPVDELPAYRTHFERRTRLDGAPVFRAEFRKKGTEVGGQGPEIGN